MQLIMSFCTNTLVWQTHNSLTKLLWAEAALGHKLDTLPDGF